LIEYDADGQLTEALPLVASMCLSMPPEVVDRLIAAPHTNEVIARYHGLTAAYVAGWRAGWRGDWVHVGPADLDLRDGYHDGSSSRAKLLTREAAICGK
jgi:hypothetical protein